MVVSNVIIPHIEMPKKIKTTKEDYLRMGPLRKKAAIKGILIIKILS